MPERAGPTDPNVGQRVKVGLRSLTKKKRQIVAWGMYTEDEARNAGRKGGQVSRGGRGRLVVPPQPGADAPPAPEAHDAMSTASRAE